MSYASQLMHDALIDVTVMLPRALEAISVETPTIVLRFADPVACAKAAMLVGAAFDHLTGPHGDHPTTPRRFTCNGVKFSLEVGTATAD